jgi:hypothetical protein
VEITMLHPEVPEVETPAVPERRKPQ